MELDEWIGHSTARRKLAGNAWEYEDKSLVRLAFSALIRGINLPEIDGFIEQLEAEGVGAGRELRERRQLAFEQMNNEPVFLRHLEWVVSRCGEIKRGMALLSEINRLKRQPPPTAATTTGKTVISDIPGTIPTTASGKLGVKAAWCIECKTGRVASMLETMDLLMEWAATGAEADLKEVGKDKRSVVWLTTKGYERNYSRDALGKTLEAWNNSRK